MNAIFEKIRQFRPPVELGWLLAVALSGLIMFALLRLGMIWRNEALAADVPLALLAKSFLVGLRFDLVVVCVLLIPFILWMMLPRWGWQYQPALVKHLPRWMLLFWAPALFVGLVEWEFYREFHERFNQLAIQYLAEDSLTVGSMIWHGYPVLRYLAAWLLLSLVFTWLVHRLSRKTLSPPTWSSRRHWRVVLPLAVMTLLLAVAGARGSVTRGTPIRWGDAYFSQSEFANHLALNGVYMLGTAYRHHGHNKETYGAWMKHMTPAAALEQTRRMVLMQDDALLDSTKYPLLRRAGKGVRTLSYNSEPEHVVLILMESFSAEFVGALGAGYRATPEFDKLTKQGILFDHFFSQGTHTHQGLFATMCSFPNLPGFEYLMQNSHGRQPFPSLPAELSHEHFNTSYVYSGDYRWDNQQGFFRNQGISRFIGRDDFVNPVFVNPTWGVSDEDVFLRGVQETSELATKGHAFVLVQTLSNHAPFDLPKPAPFADLQGPERLIKRLNGIRYSDWALGQFFEKTRSQPWFNKTLFVILGDHGFGYEAPRARLDLGVHHVPLLLYYPGDRRFAGRRVNTVGSQVDVVPTVLGLLGHHSPHQSWGRDLFHLPAGDKGWAVVKPSGSQQVVALVEADRLFVTAPGMKPLAYRYTLNPWTADEITVADTDMQNAMQHLHGYVQTALKTLLDHKAGVDLNKIDRKLTKSVPTNISKLNTSQ